MLAKRFEKIWASRIGFFPSIFPVLKLPKNCILEWKGKSRLTRLISLASPAEVSRKSSEFSKFLKLFGLILLQFHSSSSALLSRFELHPSNFAFSHRQRKKPDPKKLNKKKKKEGNWEGRRRLEIFSIRQNNRTLFNEKVRSTSSRWIVQFFGWG